MPGKVSVAPIMLTLAAADVAEPVRLTTEARAKGDGAALGTLTADLTIAQLLDADGAFVAARLRDALSELIAAVPGAGAIGIDVPIGLPEREPRRADLAAKELLGARRSTIFVTPPRAVLEAPDYKAAREL